MKKYLFPTFLLFSFISTQAQDCYWQQRAAYKMEIDFDVSKHLFSGQQQLTYYNNSPDTLDRVFYHLYFNAFQPGSMMDLRSQTIEDPDSRIGNRIANLKKDEIGYHHIHSLKQDGAPLKYQVEGTILEVRLNKPLLPNGSTVFDMSFSSQVPVQIRRSGRNNSEGIDYSMSQWYPKIAEYDIEGWHANPYVGREFHGVWGDFDVTIHIDPRYTIAGTGYLQKPETVGHGYAPVAELNTDEKKRLTWHFKAPNVHDFVWAADPDYKHDKLQVPDGPMLHFFYQTDTLAENWEKLQDYTLRFFQAMNKRFGKYPYQQYSVIQAGDGGMEYPMATLISGHGSFGGLVSVTVHEAIHSWYQHLLATNESKYSWMDEGFTSYAQQLMLDVLYERERPNPVERSYRGYFSLVESGKQEPLSTHADHYNTNMAYGIASYSMGAIFLHQLSYIVGQEAFDKGMLRYFNQWKFKHPSPSNFKRVMEKTSGIELDWYFEYWVHSTKTIDYGIKSVEEGPKKTTLVTLEKKGLMPMPLDIVVHYKDGRRETYNIPLRIMRGRKKEAGLIHAEDWPWTHPKYTLKLPVQQKEIKSIHIDPTERMADVDRENNDFVVE